MKIQGWLETSCADVLGQAVGPWAVALNTEDTSISTDERSQ